MSQMEKEGFGEEFSICSSFCLGGIRGGQKTENTNSILCFYHSTIFTLRQEQNRVLLNSCKIFYQLALAHHQIRVRDVSHKYQEPRSCRPKVHFPFEAQAHLQILERKNLASPYQSHISVPI